MNFFGWRTAAILKIVFVHNSAADNVDSPISVNFCASSSFSNETELGRTTYFSLIIFYRATVMHIAHYAVAGCVRPSVCLSVTRRYSVETARHILRLFFTIG